MSKDLISVVVPVYNVEKYLRRCVDSILCQTYSNLEIILVDDGSPDNSGKICDDYKKKDKRIKVIHKENGGLSDARNVGIDACHGKYITFVDSDDWIERDYVEVLYDALKRNKVRISVGDVAIFYNDVKTHCDFDGKEEIVSPEQFFEKMLWGIRDLDNGAWAKLYETGLFDGVSYPKGRVYEDTATTYKLIDKCDNIVICSKPIYCYMKRRDSITQSQFDKKNMQLLDSVDGMTGYIQEKYPKLKDACKRKRLWARFSTLSHLATAKTANKKIQKELMDYIKKNSGEVLKFSQTPSRDKIAIWCSRFGFWCYRFFWKSYLYFNRKY